MEDWSAARCWVVALFLAVFWLNDPFFAFQTWIPDIQMEMRELQCLTVSGAVSVFMAHAVYIMCVLPSAPPNAASHNAALEKHRLFA